MVTVAIYNMQANNKPVLNAIRPVTIQNNALTIRLLLHSKLVHNLLLHSQQANPLLLK